MQGSQLPRLSWVPPSSSSSGQEAVELAARAGLILDPWEEMVLRESLGERPDGKWAAFEVGLCVPRQNGKGSILEARELAGLFLFDEGLIIHSAHEFQTSIEHFRRIKTLVEDNPEFSKRVKPNGIKNSHGEEGIELLGGTRIKFRTRTKSGARGLTGDLVIFDEAMVISDSVHAAAMPTISAKTVHGNPQIWYTGSAVDKWEHENGLVFSRVRRRGMGGGEKRLAYFEWSAPFDDPQEVPADTGPEVWGQANPGLGIRIAPEYIAEVEQKSMASRKFAVERLGVGDWYRADGTQEHVIAPETWAERGDAESQVEDPVRVAFDVAPDRSWASVSIAGKRADGKWHFEVVDRRKGTSWVAERVVQIVHDQGAEKPYCDAAGAAGSLVPEIEDLGVEVESVTSREHADACGNFFDRLEDDTSRHIDQASLNSAVKGAAKRALGGAWAWDRKNSSVDITPLVSCTLALWAAVKGLTSSVYEERGVVVL